jgi:hypothetical protein
MKYWLVTHTCNGEVDIFVLCSKEKPSWRDAIANSNMDYNCQDALNMVEIKASDSFKYRIIPL